MITAQQEGNEDLTLQPLYENRSSRVMYIHSKGTYHPSQVNNMLRDVLMKAVTSSECLSMPSDGTCDTCGSQLAIFPTLHYSGNMFVAECDYVAKLISPKDFEAKKRGTIDALLFNATIAVAYGIDSYQFPESERNSGTGRYAMEHWLGSHPDFKPCDVFSEEIYGFIVHDIKHLTGAMTKILVPKLRTSLDPNFKPLPHWRLPDMKSSFLELPGRMYQYQSLYDKLPDNSSWIYSLFE